MRAFSSAYLPLFLLADDGRTSCLRSVGQRVDDSMRAFSSVYLPLFLSADGGRPSRAGPTGEPVDDGRHPDTVTDRKPVHRAWFPWRLRGARHLQRPGADWPEAEFHTWEIRSHRQRQRSHIMCVDEQAKCLFSTAHLRRAHYSLHSLWS